MVILLSSCATTPPKPEVPATTTVELKKPTLTLAPNYQYEREVDGVLITLTPVEFSEKEYVQREIEEKPSILTVGGVYTYDVVEKPVFQYEPENLNFKLSLTNRLDHVLRMKDCVVSFTIDGKPYAGLDVDELTGSVLVPNQSYEGEVDGPAYAELKNPCNIVFSIYDVVTQVDAANNPTKRTNFEWVLTYNVNNVQKEAQIKHYEKKMTREQAAAFLKGEWQ
jgi:hypothetical protein